MAGEVLASDWFHRFKYEGREESGLFRLLERVDWQIFSMHWGVACSVWSSVVYFACAQASCTPATKTSCGVQFCNFQLIARPSCAFKWGNLVGANLVNFMCLTSQNTGTCSACPKGWTASGAFCVECDSLSSCLADGTQACLGGCKSGNYPTCDSFSLTSVCNQCGLNYTALALERKIVTRGGVLDDPSSCAAYFQCEVGYYLSQGSGQSLSCSACVYPEESSAGRAFVSHGLTFGDQYSCMYATPPPSLALNSHGQYGSPIQSCPPLTTSQPGAGVSLSDCVPCPNPPAFGGFSEESSSCAVVCRSGYIRRGETCVALDPDCSAEGYESLDGKCEPQPMPWNAAGTYSMSLAEVAVSARGETWAALDEAGYYRVVAGVNKLARADKADVCAGLISTVPVVSYVQDLPLYTSKCGDFESHSHYLLAAGAKYLYAFLERSFGNNNRFVMWQVLRQPVGGVGLEGQVMQAWRLPGKVCSAVVGAAGDVVYLAFCGSPLVSFVMVTDYLGVGSVTYDMYSASTGYLIKRQARVLVGQDAPGNRDGMRDQAMFRGPLSIAATSDSRRLFVADKGNCRVAEVVIDSPGSFLTRATTIGESACFSGDFPLPYPRLMASLPGGAAAVFVTENGLVQVDSAMKRFVSVLSRSELQSALGGDPLWINVLQEGERIELHTATHVAVVTRNTQACPAGFVSKRGGRCLACPQNTYYSANACNPCSNVTCGPNTKRVACTDVSDARCEACTGTAAFAFRYGSGCEIVPQYPCPAGYYGLSDCYTCSARQLAQLPSHGVCQCLALPLAGASKTCVIASPFAGAVGPFVAPSWASQMACTYLDGNCTERGCYLQQAVPRRCTPCPAGTVSWNGLWCEACPGFREPNPSQDACVCKPPSSLSQDGLACVCPAGYVAGGSAGCSPCPAGTVREAGTVLPDAYLTFAGGACQFCQAGFEPQADRASCRACADGKFREGAMQACAACPGKAFAKDPASSSSCTACSAICSAGKRWAKCPVDPAWFSCVDCPAISRFKTWITRGGNTDCLWECVSGFYEFGGECWPCTKKACPVGFKETPCTRYEDSHCRAPCEDGAKPAENSAWGPDCTWSCLAGFDKVEKSYPGWTEYSCEKQQELPWSLGW